MKHILGAHMSIAGGISQSLLRGQKTGCDAIQIFTKPANQWKAKEITKEEIDAFLVNQKKTGIAPVVAHDSYLINLASPDQDALKKSLNAFIEEIKRADLLSLPYLITHPGSHLNTGKDQGIKTIADSLNTAIEETKEAKVMVLLETTAGQGTNLGCSFEELSRMISLIHDKKRIGICLDTCHIFASGYDLRDTKSYEETIKKFDTVIGLDKLKIIHLNDAKKELGSRIDRHEHIGKGAIGIEGFRLLMNDERLKNIPMILETPKGEEMDEDKENLRILRSLIA